MMWLGKHTNTALGALSKGGKLSAARLGSSLSVRGFDFGVMMHAILGIQGILKKCLAFFRKPTLGGAGGGGVSFGVAEE